MPFLSLCYRYKQALVGLIIVLLSGLGALLLSRSTEQVPGAQHENGQGENYAPAVTVIQSSAATYPIKIQGYGSLEAHTRIQIAPQVSGKISYIHPHFRRGGLVTANEVLLEIEKADYQLQVTQREADVIAARTALALEKAEAATAQKGWRALKPQQKTPTLVGRQPQIAQAQATLKAAEAQLARARLALQRTTLYMPFTGRVISASISAGEAVNRYQVVGQLYRNQQFEIAIALSIDELAWVELPTQDKAGTVNQQGSQALIEFSMGNQDYQLPGTLTHIGSELDQRTRLAELIVRLDAKDIPAAIKDRVIPGLFVSVSVFSQALDNLHQLPASALRKNNTLWAVVDNKLSLLKPRIIHRSGDKVYIRHRNRQLTVITSALDVVTEGMDVSILESW